MATALSWGLISCSGNGSKSEATSDEVINQQLLQDSLQKEAERIEAEKAELERLRQEQLDREKAEQERLEKEEQERKEREQKEQEEKQNSFTTSAGTYKVADVMKFYYHQGNSAGRIDKSCGHKYFNGNGTVQRFKALWRYGTPTDAKAKEVYEEALQKYTEAYEEGWNL